MSGKNQYPVTLNWQATNPATTFNPQPNTNGSAPSGVTGGIMSGTNTIYSQILPIANMDNTNLEVSWTGNPVGTLQVLVSNSGLNFPALTFNPPIQQPVGVAGYLTIDLNQLGSRFLMLQYANTSGSGVLSVIAQNKDLN